MKLSFILIIGFLQSFIESKDFYNYGYLQKDSYGYIGSGAFYLNTSEFKGDRNVYLKFEVTDGYFEEDYLYYGGNPSTPYQVNLEKTKDNYKKVSFLSQRTGYNIEYLLDEYAYFKIPIPDEQYLFISVPKFNSLSSSLKVIFDSTLSIGEIVGIAFGCSFGVIIIIAAISIFFKIRKRKIAESSVSQPLRNNP